MTENYFQNPQRFPLNVEGPFYTTGHPNYEGGMTGDCLACEAPEHEAPELLAALTQENFDTYFIRQPTTPHEIDVACNAMRVCCVTALRYGGCQKSVILQLGNSPEYCDYLIDQNDELVLCVDDRGDLLQFAQKILNRIIERRKNELGNG